jgi:hypothetical protein
MANATQYLGQGGMRAAEIFTGARWQGSGPGYSGRTWLAGRRPDGPGGSGSRDGRSAGGQYRICRGQSLPGVDGSGPDRNGAGRRRGRAGGGSGGGRIAWPDSVCLARWGRADCGLPARRIRNRARFERL